MQFQWRVIMWSGSKVLPVPRIRDIAVVEKPGEQGLIDIDAFDLVHVHFDRTRIACPRCCGGKTSTPGSTARSAPNALRPATESALREWPAARRVNGAGVGDDDPTIIDRVDVA